MELYDIITLDNDNRYTIIEKTVDDNKSYLLLSLLNEVDEPLADELVIVEEVSNGEKTFVKDVTDKKTIEKLSKKFVNSLEKLINELD